MAGDQGYPHGLEVMGIDYARERQRVASLLVFHADRTRAPRAVSSERKRVAEADDFDAWQSGDTTRQFA